MIDIAINGKMTSGKTTLANYIQKKIPKAKRMAIGDQIKRVSKYILFDWDKLTEVFSEFENKEEFLKSAKRLKKENSNTEFTFTEDGEFVKDQNYRPYIQEVGRISRDAFGESVWMDLFLKEAIKQKEGTEVALDDCPFDFVYDTTMRSIESVGEEILEDYYENF